MCGIVGIVGNLGQGDKEIFRDLLLMCQLRGEDSTGMFVVPNGNSEPKVAKAVGPPHELFALKAWDTTSSYSSRALIGHGRKATVGGISRHTAHPFTYDHITGIHNGTLKNWRDVDTEIQQTDSATMFKLIADVGAEEAFPQIDGAYASVWWDHESGYLNILRNGERTLYYAFSESGEKMYFASEAWMITITCDRNGQKLMDLTPKGEHVHRTLPVETDKLWRIRPGVTSRDALVFGPEIELKGGTNLPKKELPFRSPYTWQGHGTPPVRPTVVESAPSPKVLTSPSSPTPEPTPEADASTNTNLSSSTTDSKTSSSSVSTDTRPSKPLLTLPASSKSSGSEEQKPSESPLFDDLNDNIVDLFAGGREKPPFDVSETMAGNGGLLLTREEFDKLVDPNCVWCQTPHTFDELKNEGYLGDWCDDDTYICSGCMMTQYGGYTKQ